MSTERLAVGRDGVPAHEDLTSRIAAGSAAAEEQFAHSFRPRVLVLLSVRLRDRDLARELVGEVLMAVIDALRRGRIREPEKLPAFVAGTARNLANNHLRRLRGRPRLVPLAPEHASVDSPDQLDDRPQLARVRAELGQLEVVDRRILVATIVEGYKASELERELGLSSEAVRARKSRALRRIAAALGANGSPPLPGGIPERSES